MTKVITYGTYDLLHRGHIRLLERAKALGDYLVVGVTADDFDKSRGKINVQQSLMERVEAVRATGLADEVIIEEYEGQKIDDIKRLGIDIFTVGSDWVGKFDYLNEWCKVVYLDRTQGISSSEVRAKTNESKIGFIGDSFVIAKYFNECGFVNGLKPAALCTNNKKLKEKLKTIEFIADDYESLLEKVDAVYIASHPTLHYEQIKAALEKGKHVICESPIVLSVNEFQKLYKLAKEKNLVLMDAIKTAYSTAYYRMLLLVKSGMIGEVVSVDSTCTSLSLRDEDSLHKEELENIWSSTTAWGPTALLPVFQILGTAYKSIDIWSKWLDKELKFDLFSKMNLEYDNAVATVKVGKGIKSEGELIVSGTKGYVYVPAPWWKTDYFEVRFENPADNKRYFYQLDGEGIRYELLAFLKAITSGKNTSYVEISVTEAICKVFGKIYGKRNNN